MPAPLGRSPSRILVAMAEDRGEDPTRRAKSALISTAVPSAARVADYLYGGQANFEADRRAARTLAAASPVVPSIGPAVRAFQHRVLSFLVGEAGIRQFVDIGTGLPLVGSTHEVAQSLAAECRIAYVDNDPMVLSHARALLRSAPGGAVGYVDADVRDPAAIVAGTRGILDYRRPVAIMLLYTLGYVTDDAEAAAVVSSLTAAAQSGSYVAIYHLAGDIDSSVEEAARQWNKLMPSQPITLRSRDQVARLADGLELVQPGVVPVTDWRPAPGDPQFDQPIPVHCLVARKP
jgi:S-adenosyl methyltransferase